MTLVTEKEAGEKWCPMYRQTEAIYGSNRDGLTDNGPEYATPHCIGSRCMAWRGFDSYSNDAGMRVHKGYCGAFGKVEP